MVTESNKGPQNIRIEISEEEILRRIDQIENLEIEDDLRNFLIQALKALVSLDHIMGMKDTTIRRLRKIFGKKIEKKEKPSQNNKNQEGKPPRGNNNGRNGQKSYPQAPRVKHQLEGLESGVRCPECDQGNLYDYNPGIYIRITGSAPLSAVVHETQKLRCGACGKIFEASFEGKNAPKYDEKAHAIIALLKYKASIPFYRLSKIQKQLFTPMPASTQWDLMENLGNILLSVWQALIRVAAEGRLFYQDDTKAKILDFLKENKKNKNSKKFRKGIYTTGIISELNNGRKIVLFFTGRKYSGENLTEVLSKRDTTDVPVIMSDALSTNNIKTQEVLTAYCNVHGRRKFFDLGKKFEAESTWIVDKISEIYKAEKETKEKNLSPEERLAYHQKISGPIMDEIKNWCDKVFDEKLVEPTSTLGQSVKYLQKHWEGLTEFLRTAGTPLLIITYWSKN